MVTQSKIKRVPGILNRDEIDVVMYHGRCTDGFGSAYVIWYYFQTHPDAALRERKITFIPCRHLSPDEECTDRLIQRISNRNVIMCDFSYRPDQMQRILDAAAKFQIIDHHITAMNNLRDLPDTIKIFDMKKSGCGLTWEFMFPDRPIPKFLLHIQDNDIWTLEIPGTEEFSIFFQEQTQDFELWRQYHESEELVEDAITTGRSWLCYRNTTNSNLMGLVEFIVHEINGHYQIVAYINSGHNRSLVAMMRDRFVCGQEPLANFACGWYYNYRRKQTHFHLISDYTATNVEEVADKLGGGGHRNASAVDVTGVQPYLNLPIISESKVPRILASSEVIVDEISDRSYLLIIDIDPQVLNSHDIDLIKRMRSNISLLVFQNTGEDIGYDRQTRTVTPSYDYHVYFNDKNPAQSAAAMSFMMMNGEAYFTFNSEFEFRDVLRNKGLVV